VAQDMDLNQLNPANILVTISAKLNLILSSHLSFCLPNSCFPTVSFTDGKNLTQNEATGKLNKKKNHFGVNRKSIIYYQR
jgi:hypothetical protein